MRVSILPVLPVVPVIPPHPELPDSRWLADWENRDFLGDQRGRRYQAVCVGGERAAGPRVAARQCRHWRGGRPSSSWDGVSRGPVRGEPGLDDESGRGLALVDAFSAKWDYYFPPCPFWGKVTRAFIVNG